MIREIRIYVCDAVGTYCVEFFQDGNCALSMKYAILPSTPIFDAWFDRAILPQGFPPLCR